MVKQCVLILVVMALCSSAAQAAIPKSGTFNIDGSSGLTFAPIPTGASSVYLWPFASYDKYAGSGANWNLAEVWFSAGSFITTDKGEINGDLGVRVGNYTGGAQTIEACILTLDFVGGSGFNVYLPEFTFGSNENIFFWISESGATYYAHFSKGAGSPPTDMSAAEAMSAGDEYLARVPEPATFLLLGLGGLAAVRKHRA